MITSPAGRKLIEEFEGLSLAAYQDQRGIQTIGYGHTAGVKSGDTCTQAEADAWLGYDLQTAESAVNSMCVSLTQNQFDALVSLTYNIGIGNFGESTVRKRLTIGTPDYQGAAEAFLMWDKTNGAVNPGLVNRRTAEKALFLTAPAVSS
jgi:lysozyme